MTVIDGIEMDTCKRNYNKEAIRNNTPIEEYLHVIMVISNPCNFKRRYKLAREFILRMNQEEKIKLYIVELCYGDQPFSITEVNNLQHLQLRSEYPLWHKENMINCGISLLPRDWKAFAWIDADLEFESTTWVKDTLSILNGHSDIVQLFSHALDMDQDELTMSVFNSAGYQYEKGNPMKNGPNFWHPGFAWAITRKAYERIGGLYQYAILGSGDNIMMWSLIKNVHKVIDKNNTPGYLSSIFKFQEKMYGLRFGYVPGVIRHFFHGKKINRNYINRSQILIKHNYEPEKHIKLVNGILTPTQDCPVELLEDIMSYFKERNEDEL